MAFSLFGKKPAESKSEDTKSPDDARAPAASAPGPARRLGGVADYFAGGAPGRFGSRAARRGLAGDGPPSSTYNYGSEVSANSVEAIGDELEPVTQAAPWRVAGPPSTEEGALTVAAFTQLPSQIDVGADPRRPARLAPREMPQALENCALSYANGQTSEALKCIEDAIRDESLGQWGLQAWLMRFDLYVHLQLKAAFEAQALTFATLFERSPPVWHDDNQDVTQAAPTTPRVHITGVLSAASAAPLSALRKTVERYPGVRLDFSRLESADKDGCRYLLVTIQSLKRARKIVEIANDETILDLLRPNIQVGNRATDATTWLLYLELLQLSDRPAEFEHVAIQYATTFEVSPPSWQTGAKANAAPIEEVAAEDRFTLAAEVVVPMASLLEELERYAKDHQLVVVDLARTRRIDFVACSQLTNTLSKLQQSGHAIELRAPNEMVSALLGLMGATEIGRVVARRG